MRSASQPAMIDPFGRRITYLRVSVTDRCDFRCVYCMAESTTFLPRKDLLTLEEIDRLTSAFVAKGVRKVRLTGGEPLMRKNLMWLINSLSRHLGQGLDELTLTTNGSRGRAFNGVMVRRALEIFLDAQYPKPEVRALSNGDLAEYEGRYEAALAKGDVTIKEGGLLLTVVNEPRNDEAETPPPVPPGPFVFVGDDDILALEGTFEGSKGHFARDEQGKVKWLHLGGRIYHRKA